MLKKYHKELYFNSEDLKEISLLISNMNQSKIIFSNHVIQEIHAEYNALEIAKFLKCVILSFDNLFEYQKEDGIVKLGFRYQLNNMEDIVFILSRNKVIVTCWINKKSDKHFTLNPSNYITV